MLIKADESMNIMAELKKIITNDGSITFHNFEFDETYHSITGAEEEALKKFSEPCKIKEMALQKEIFILDVCFGLGYNSAVAIEEILKINSECKIKIFALENDLEILKKITEIDSSLESFVFLKQIPELINNSKENVDLIHLENNNIDLTIFVDDALVSIKKVPKKSIDLVFQDPFSPKKCPELWTKDFFYDIKKTMKKSGVLATYSCAGQVRRNLKEANFIVKDGPCVGRRSPGTLAYLE